MKKYISIVLSVVLSAVSFNVVLADDEQELQTDAPEISIEVLPMEEYSENDTTSIDSSIMDETDNGAYEKKDGELEDNNEEVFENDGGIEVLSLSDSDKWSTAENMIEARTDADFITVGGELYAIGGYGNSGYLSSIERYNPTDQTWSKITNIPNAPKGFSVAASEEKIYIIGGYRDNDYLNEVKIYNTISNSWSTGIPMNEKRDQAAALYTDNKLYVFGGRNRIGLVNSYEFFDFADNSWNTVTTGFDESLIRIGADARYIDGYVCVYGGMDKDCGICGADMYLASDMKNVRSIVDKDKYDDISIAWGLDKAMIFARNSNSGASAKQEMKIENGAISLHNFTITNAPQSRKYSKYVIYNGYLNYIGGYSSGSYFNNVYRYSVNYGDYGSGDGVISGTVTAGGNSVTLNVETDKEYMLMFNVKNMSSFSGYTFNIDYPANSFYIVDGCAMTDKRDTTVGTVTDTDLRITRSDSSGISFASSEQVPQSKYISETVNAVIIKARSSGKRTITYSMTR